MSVLKDAEFIKRIETFRIEMQNQNIDLMLIYADIWRAKNVAYFTDYRSGAGGTGQAWNLLLLPSEGEHILFTGYEMVDDALLQGRNLKKVFPSYDLEKRLIEYCEDNNPKKVGFIGSEIVTHNVFSTIQKVLKDVEIVDCDEILSRKIWIKTEEEIKAIKKATLINDKAMLSVIDAISEGITELELSSIGASIITGNGADLAFFPTVGTGTNSAIAMKRPTNRKVKRGDVVLLDFGAIYEGYASDTSRTVGYHLEDSKLRNMLHAALAAREAALLLIKPGIKACEIEAAVRNTISQKGFAEFLLHNSGHGLGVDSSEEEFPMSLESDLILQKGMVFTVEPGIYIPDLGGCRIEEVVHVTENGCEVFSELKPDFFIE